MGKPNQKRKQRNRSENEQNEEKKIKLMEQEIGTLGKREEIIPDDTVKQEEDSQDAVQAKVRLWMQKQRPYLETGYDEIEEYITEENEASSQVLPEDTEILLRERLKNYSEEEKCQSVKYECEWKKCSYLSGQDRKYFLHIELHATETMANDEGSYNCAWDLCDFVAESKEDLVGHVHYHGYHTKLKVHGASLTFLLKIPACSYDSRTRNTISKRSTSFSCEWDGCGQRFNKAMHYFHHVDTHIFDLFTPGVKSAKEPQRCLWLACKASFREQWKAVRHINAHTGRRALACYNCGEMFRERCKYLDHCHRQIELADRKYQCPECDRFYATQRLLKAHLAKHTKNVQCTLCPLSFPSMATLSRHILTRHTKDRPFACNQCSYRSVTKYELEKHLPTHSTKNVYRCSEFGCNVVYKSESSIKRHISMHYNRPVHYECHICSKNYRLGCSLSTHLVTVHKVERLYGHTRFRYKIDTDGVFRLASYIDARDKKSGLANVPQESDSTSPAGCTVEEVSQEALREKDPLGDDPSKLLKPTISSITPKGNTFILELLLQPDGEPAGCTVEEVSQEALREKDPLVDEPIKLVKPTISSITPKGNTFILELSLQPDSEPTGCTVEEVSLEALREKDPLGDASQPGSEAADAKETDFVQTKGEVVEALSKEEKASATTSFLEEQSIKQEDGSKTSEVKQVQDFTVMRRYLKCIKMPKISGKSND